MRGPLVTAEYNYTPILHFVKGLRSLFNTFHRIFIFPIFWGFSKRMKLNIVYYIFVKNKYKICEKKENVIFSRFLRSFSAKELSKVLLLCYNRRKHFRRGKTKEEPP